MKEIAIFVEGGGDSKEQKAEIRRGLDGLLRQVKDEARAKRLGWKLVPCGGRGSTCDAFLNEIRNGSKDTLCVLLVDSEEELPELTRDFKASAEARKTHLIQRDKWELAPIAAEQIHLMVQTMEAWIAADVDALAKFYGQKFHANKLPTRQNLEKERKQELANKLAAATKDTQKGEYHKINHSGKILLVIDAKKVTQRCAHFSILIKWLGEQINTS